MCTAPALQPPALFTSTPKAAKRGLEFFIAQIIDDAQRATAVTLPATRKIVRRMPLDEFDGDEDEPDRKRPFLHQFDRDVASDHCRRPLQT